MTIAVVAALREEMAPLARELAGRRPAAAGRWLRCAHAGEDLWLMATGDGAPRAAAALRELLAAASPEVLIGLGSAGGLTEDLAVGDLIVLDRIVDDTSGRSYGPPPSPWLDRARRVAGGRCGTAVSARAIAVGREARRELARLIEAPAVVDLESAAWSDIASAEGIAFVIARAVTDAHDETLPLDFERLRDATGSVDRRRVLAAALVRPWTWLALWRLRRRLRRASALLAEWALEVLRA